MEQKRINSNINSNNDLAPLIRGFFSSAVLTVAFLILWFVGQEILAGVSILINAITGVN